MIIAKEFTFDAAHKLPNEECYGKCRNYHGHTYKLVVEVEGFVNEKGWVMNFKELKNIINARVIEKLDHSDLNNKVEVSTAENLLLWIEQQVNTPLSQLGVDLSSLTLWETPTSYAKINY